MLQHRSFYHVAGLRGNHARRDNDLFDVTDHLAITEAAKKVEAETGKEGLACLINNAGISTSGP